MLARLLTRHEDQSASLSTEKKRHRLVRKPEEGVGCSDYGERVAEARWTANSREQDLARLWIGNQVRLVVN